MLQIWESRIVTVAETVAPPKCARVDACVFVYFKVHVCTCTCHPSAADEAWYLLKHVLCSGWFCTTSRSIFKGGSLTVCVCTCAWCVCVCMCVYVCVCTHIRMHVKQLEAKLEFSSLSVKYLVYDYIHKIKLQSRPPWQTCSCSI